MDIKEITFLNYDQVFGNEQLKIFNEYGTKATITDFSILLGGWESHIYPGEGNTGKDITGFWWTKTTYFARVCAVNTHGIHGWEQANTRAIGARPALPYSSIQSIASNEVRGKSEIKEIEYGEYPQTIVDENYSRELERAYNNGSLRTTGKNYTTDLVSLQDVDTSFRARIHIEYEYNGSKYIRFVGDSNSDGDFLSDGREIHSGNVYWVRVEPITWLVDERANIALSKKIIFSGVQFRNCREYKGDFNSTDIKQFMDNCFLKEIVSDRVYSQTKEEKKLNEIYVLLQEIGRYANYSNDIETLKNYVNMLIDEYNNNLDALDNNKLQLKIDSSSGYKQKLIINLQNVLDNLKNLYNKKRQYEEIIISLNNYKDILSGNEINSDDELEKDFEKICKVINYTDDLNLKLEFINLIDTEIEKIENYLKNIYDKNKKIEYDDQKSFELYFRTKIHPLITKLHINVVNKNIVNEMTKIIGNEIDSLVQTQKYSVIEFYLNEIKKQVAVIKKLDVTNEYDNTLKQLLNIEFEKLGDTKTTLKVLTDILCKLYEIELGITNKQNIRKQKITTNFEDYITGSLSNSESTPNNDKKI